MTVCFGDSITAGHPGESYLRYLPSGSYRNRGLGGDTLTGLGMRLKRFLDKHHCDELIIEIGTNDILQPFLYSYSDSWHQAICGLRKKGLVPLETEDEFYRHYDELILFVKAKQILPKIINIPCIGENPDNALNIKADAYNNCIKKLCNKYDLEYLDINAWQKKILQERQHNGNPYFLDKDYSVVFRDALVTSIKGMSMKLSRQRSLILTMDGVHLNQLGAQGLAVLVQGT